MTAFLKILLTLSKIPKEDGSMVIGLGKIVLGIVVVLFILMSFPVALVSGLQGVDLDAEIIDPFQSPSYSRVVELYEEFMDEIWEEAEKRKKEYEQKGIKTITENTPVWIEGYWTQEKVVFETYIPVEINGEKGMMPVKHYRMEDVYVEGYWMEGIRTRTVQTTFVEIDIQESDLALMLAYLTITDQMSNPEAFEDEAAINFMESFLRIHQTTYYLTDAERAAKTGDGKYIEKEILIYNTPLVEEVIADYFFAEDEVMQEMFMTSIKLYKSFLEKGKSYE